MKLHFSILAVFCLSACSGGPKFAPLVRADLQDIGFAEPALNRSVDALLGKNTTSAPGASSGAGAASSSAGPPGPSESDTLDNTKFEIRDMHDLSLGAMVHQDYDFGGRVALRLLAGRGRTEIYLPDGADILVDPITITAKTRFFEAAVVLEQKMRLPYFFKDRISLLLEAGHRRTESKVALRSALIARDDTGTDDQSFVGAGLRLELGPGRKTVVDLGARRIDEKTSTARLGLERRF